MRVPSAGLRPDGFPSFDQTQIHDPAEIQELIMSGINGDKARFHRLRKQKIARRLRNQEMLKEMAAPAKPAKSSKSASSRAAE
jgi:hypothetical protein